jgi:tetratricopeptide (TPR) repeat protein
MTSNLKSPEHPKAGPAGGLEKQLSAEAAEALFWREFKLNESRDWIPATFDRNHAGTVLSATGPDAALIRLAAKVARTKGLDALTQGIQLNQKELSEMFFQAEGRLSSNRALLSGYSVIRYALSILDRPAVDTLGQLGIFPNTFDAAGVEAVSGVPNSASVLNRLSKELFLTVVSREEGQRYAIPSRIRNYVQQQLLPVHSAAPLKRRFCEYFGKIAREKKDITVLANFRCMDDEWENLYAAAQHAEMIGDHEGLIEITEALHDILSHTKRIEEAYTLHKKALSALRRSAPNLKMAIALKQYGATCEELARSEEALKCYNESLSILQDLKNLPETARVLNNIALLWEKQGHWKEARKYYQQSLGLARQTGARRVEATVLLNLGILERQNNPEVAEQLYRESLSISQQIGDRLGEASVLVELAEQLSHRDHWTNAEEAYHRALEIYRLYKLDRNVRNILEALAKGRNLQGDPVAAKKLHREAEEISMPEGTREVDFSKLLSLDLFIALSKKCHELKKEDQTRVPEQRVTMAFTEVFKSQEGVMALLPLLRKKDQKEALFQFVVWLAHVLRPLMDEFADQAHKAGGGILGFVRYDQPMAGWHNLKAQFGRIALEGLLTEGILKTFPHWKNQEVRERLREVPPMALLNTEITPQQEAAQALLSFDFILDFLSSSYLMHLGEDPVIRQPVSLAGSIEKDSAEGQFAYRISRLLRAHSPRYVQEPYREHFQKVKSVRPFASAFEDAVKALQYKGWDAAAVEDSLRALTFPFSLTQAHQILLADDRQLLFGNESSASYVASLISADYCFRLQKFDKSNRFSDTELFHFALQVPTVTEMWGLQSQRWTTPTSINDIFGTQP